MIHIIKYVSHHNFVFTPKEYGSYQNSTVHTQTLKVHTIHWTGSHQKQIYSHWKWTIHTARAEYQLNSEHMTELQFEMYINWILEKLVPQTKRNQRKVLRSVCAEMQVRGVWWWCATVDAGRCADCLRCNALRAGWLHSIGALWCTGCDVMPYDTLWCTGCDTMRWLLDALGLVKFAWCVGWLHSRGAVCAMLLTEGFLGWGFFGIG